MDTGGTDRIIKKKKKRENKDLKSGERQSNFKFSTIKCHLILLTAI